MKTPVAPHKSVFYSDSHIAGISPFNSENITTGNILVAINNKRISSWRQLKKIYKNEVESKSPVVTLQLRNGSLTKCYA